MANGVTNPRWRGALSRLYGRVVGERRPCAAQVVGIRIMSRVIALMACGFMLAACSATMPSLDFLKSTPQPETLAIESEPPGAEAKTSLGESCRTPCKLAVQPGSEFSVTLALSGYQPQTVSVRPEAEGAAAGPRLAPNPVRVDLRPVTPAKKLVAKKKKPVAAAARPAAPPPMASAASPPAPAPAPAPALAPAPSAPTEAAPSATNYPWPSR
jgi:PEGA domain